MSKLMTTVINARGFAVTPAIRAHLNRRFEAALELFNNRIIHLEVFLKDLNGAGKGGEDQSVLVSVSLRGQPRVITETVTDDLYLSISMAARRTRRAVHRALERPDHMSRQTAERLYLPSTATAEIS
jgi:ribosome-associated translation inhibitor RaiA